MGSHQWNYRTRSYDTIPAEVLDSVEDAATAILHRVADAVDWPRLLREAMYRHSVVHPRQSEDGGSDNVCGECLKEALLSDETGGQSWRTNAAARPDKDIDWPGAVHAAFPYRAASTSHPWKNAPAPASTDAVDEA
ncbi:hypothetical protein [Kitasatospora sp. NPDC088783]|uniref:hypothetical protein n=1 Tax=Kitasatospora sp. NPDC088783 TaxID=3364077 RepID=UPI0038304BC9